MLFLHLIYPSYTVVRVYIGYLFSLTMPDSPRKTRSNSNSACGNVSLADIKTWIQSSQEEIVNSLKPDLNKITDMLKTLVERVDHLDNKCSKLEQRCTQLEENSGKMMFEVAEEVEARVRRRKNVIVSGVELKIDGTLEERKAGDMEKVCEVLSTLGVSDAGINDVHRIGNPGQAGRALLKVKFDTEDTKQIVIRKSKQLRESYPKVYINIDRTPAQQAQHKKLRQEFKSRREIGEDVIIYKNQVVPRGSKQNFRYQF